MNWKKFLKKKGKNMGSSRLSQLRRDFIDYHENPARFLDMSTLAPYDRHGDQAVFTVRGKSFGEACGLQALGSGLYATAYAIDEKRVLKVISQRDDAYERYVNNVVRKLRNNPYVPRIYYSGTWGPKTVYIMERLNETCIDGYKICGINRYEMNRHEIRALEKQHKQQLEKLNEENKHRELLSSAFRNAVATIYSAIRRNQGMPSNPFMHYDPKLVEVVTLMREHGTYNDFHSGNVMFRGDTPVITDPAS